MRSGSSRARSAASCSGISVTSTGARNYCSSAILLVGAVTFLMGCLPTFGQIGYWAPALLVVLRFLQGFAVGGEWGGAVLLVAEHSPNRSRAFWASWPQAAVPRRQHARHRGAPRVDRDAVGGVLPVVGMAGRVLAVRRSGAHRLLHPYQGERRADLPRGAAGNRAGQGRVVWRGRGAQALSAWGFHRDGTAVRREHHVLPGGHRLDHLSQAAGRCRHQRHPVVAAGRTCGALPGHPTGGAAGGSIRPASGVHRRRHRRGDVGVLRDSR